MLNEENILFPPVNEDNPDTPPLFPHPPCNPFFTPPKSAFTLNEEFAKTVKLVNENISRVLRLEEMLRKTVEDHIKIITADNVQFKNLCIETYNNFATGVFNDLTTFKATISNAYELFKNDCNLNFEMFKTIVEEKIKELNKYVADNFNKTVATELTKMRNNGELAEIFTKSVLADMVNVTDFNGTVAGLATKEEIETERKRIDSFLSLPEGTSTFDAEIIDAREIGDGREHNTLGDATREVCRIAREGGIKFHYTSFVQGNVINGKHADDNLRLHSNLGAFKVRKGDALYVETSKYYVSVEVYDDLTKDTPTQLYKKTWFSTGANNDAYVDKSGKYELLTFDVAGDLVVLLATGKDYASSTPIAVLTQGATTMVLFNGSIGRATTSNAKNIADVVATEKGLFYVSNNAPVEFSGDEATGDVSVILRGATNLAFKYADKNGSVDWITAGEELRDIGKLTTAENGDGVDITIVVPYKQTLVFNTETELLHIRNGNIKHNDLILVHTAWSYPVGGLLYEHAFKKRVEKLENSGGNPIEINREKINEFCSKIANAGGDFETFMFFTDPHLCEFAGDDWRAGFNSYMDALGAYYKESPVNRVICGGDWLGNSETKEEAIYRLGLVNATMRDKFTRGFYNVVGNHDTNYQGKLNSESENGTGTLADNQIAKVLQGRPETYFAVDTDNTTFIFLSTGLDRDVNVLSMSNKPQLEWFIEMLKRASNTVGAPKNVVVIMHGAEYNKLCEKFLLICDCLNNYTTDMIFYDDDELSEYPTSVDGFYSDNGGRVRVIIAGHEHIDETIDHNGIPIVKTTHLRDGGTPTFDYCLLDYNEMMLKTVRVGTGENREIPLYQ